MSVLIILAHSLEAAPVLQGLSARYQERNLYEFAGGHIVVSGVGVVAAAVATALHHQSADEVWNIGVAGALDSSLNLGELVEIGTVSRHLWLPDEIAPRSRELAIEAHPPFTISSQGMRLVSCDHGVQTSLLQQSLAREHHVVDMEGYGVARACAAVQKKCRIWKIISDHAGHDASDEIRRRIPLLAQKIAEHLCQALQV